jgi:hypothetical protein
VDLLRDERHTARAAAGLRSTRRRFLQEESRDMRAATKTLAAVAAVAVTAGAASAGEVRPTNRPALGHYGNAGPPQIEFDVVRTRRGRVVTNLRVRNSCTGSNFGGDLIRIRRDGRFSAGDSRRLRSRPPLIYDVSVRGRFISATKARVRFTAKRRRGSEVRCRRTSQRTVERRRGFQGPPTIRG